MHILKSQHFSDESLIQYAANLSSRTGPLEERLLHWSFGPLMTMRFDAEAKNYLFSEEPVPLHWDGAFFKEPRLLLFYCTESEGLGGETLFTNTEKMWESLTATEQDLCRRITLTFETAQVAHYGGKITVPLVQTHPNSGKTILRFAERVETHLNPVSLQISGIDHAEEFYQIMIKKLYGPQFMYEHSWQTGDLLVCDNYTFLHGRRALGLNKKRTFKRIQIL